MQVGTKPRGRGGRPRKFDEGEALGNIQRQIWTSGLSGVSLDGIARSAGLNRPSLAAAFGDKDEIYAKAARHFVGIMDARMNHALSFGDLETALRTAFDTAIDIYTANGPDGCFVICTAPAEAQTSPVCQAVLDQALQAIDAVFLRRLQQDAATADAVDLPLLAAQLGATLHSIALRARAGWSPDRLQALARATIGQVLVAARTGSTA